MRRHLIANLWLIGLSLFLCCVLYPLVLYAIGQAAFRHQAEGSLLDAKGRPTTDAGKAVGSRLIGQPFTQDEYFQPRPSATSPSYNAAASGASNWCASNPLLRDRVARALGPIVTYASGPKKGQRVGPDIEAWFAEQAPDYAAKRAQAHPTSAEQWVKDNPEAVAQWLGMEVDAVNNAPAEAVKAFFAAYVKRHPGTWPTVEEKQIKPARQGSDIQAYLFDDWLRAHPSVDLTKVPADLVMASGSGLDPHITWQNAQFQLDRVTAAWVEKTKADPKKVRQEIERILEEKKEAPLGGLVGVPLINVLEVNLVLADRIPQLAR